MIWRVTTIKYNHLFPKINPNSKLNFFIPLRFTNSAILHYHSALFAIFNPSSDSDHLKRSASALLTTQSCVCFIFYLISITMKIGVSCYPTYGGSGVVAAELGKALAERGHKIHFITYAMPIRLDGFSENIVYHEVEISNYPLFEFPLYTPPLASKIVEGNRVAKLHII